MVVTTTVMPLERLARVILSCHDQVYARELKDYNWSPDYFGFSSFAVYGHFNRRVDCTFDGGGKNRNLPSRHIPRGADCWGVAGA